MKNLKIRFLALISAGVLSASAGSFAKANSLDDEDWSMASYYETMEENDDIDSVKLATYTVVKGDSSSRISQKLYGDTKYWPVIAYCNPQKYPGIIHPGDELECPKTLKGADVYLSYIKSIGWYDMYVMHNNIYGTTRTIGDIMNDVYGEDASADPELVNAFIRLIGLDPSKVNAGTYYSDRLINEYPSYEQVVNTINTNRKSK